MKTIILNSNGYFSKMSNFKINDLQILLISLVWNFLLINLAHCAFF